MDTLTGSRRRPAGWLLVTGLCAVACASAGWAATPSGGESQVPQTFGIQMPGRTLKAQKPVRLMPSERAGITLVAVPEVRLQAVDRDALLKEDALNEREHRTKITRFGIARSVQVAAGDGNWYDVGGGAKLWVADVVSADAIGIRLHFKNVHLPAGAELAVYSPNDKTGASGTLRNGFPAFDPGRYVEHYQGSEAQALRTDFWSGTMFGERVRVEYLAPAGAADAELPFAMDSLQHLYLDPVAKVAQSLVQTKAAGPCHNDVTCFPEWANVARSTSVIAIVFDNGTGFCTGQLLNSQAGDFTPYYLTANHCLSTSQDAANSEFFWFYQTSTCNGTPPSLDSVPRSEGATLQSTSATSDYTLLMVEGTLPDGLFWDGWVSAKVADGTDAACIHHPQADFKRISFGFKDESSACGDPNFVRISWTDGPTEPGSSGSGVYRADTHQLFGQLYGGPSACGSETFDCYGAFASTYPKIKNLLKAGSDDSSEQNDSCSKPKTAPKGTLRGRIVKVFDTDWYKISVPAHKTLTIHLSFVNANGDIDLDFYGSTCGASPLFTSRSTDDQETIQVTNAGSKAAVGIWQVYLADDTRNSYDMTVSIQ
ncbi:MAG: trypsin-like peptidase domain-containing protein [Thermoanaerobaculia bacterium]